MSKWEPWVRATIVDFELVSQLRFRGKAPKFTLSYALDKAGEQDIVTMTAPSIGFFKSQLRHVLEQAELRDDRATEILSQLGLPIAFWSAIANLHPSRTPKTLELLDAAFRLANFVEMRFKHALACNRPLEHSSQVQPMILTPGHGSLPSGHSTEAFTVANVLVAFLELKAGDVQREQLMRQAARIAINRQIAGVHFPVDSGAGQVLGSALAEYFLFRCTGEGTLVPWTFDPKDFGEKNDFDWTSWTPSTTGGVKCKTESGALGWLWLQARAEFGRS